jgi:uncharacterized membrane protein
LKKGEVLKIEEKFSVLAGWAFVLFALFMVTIAIAISLPQGIKNLIDWPAWVQAVGSIAAIGVAIGISVWERQRDKRKRALDRDEARSKAVHVASLAFGLVCDGLNDLSEIAEGVPPNIYALGMAERFRDTRSFIASLDLSLLTTNETAAIVKARDGCSAAIALLLAPSGVGDIMTRLHFAQGAQQIGQDVERARESFNAG